MLKEFVGIYKLKKIQYISLLGMLLALRMVLQLVSIPLGYTTFSFTWITLVITGFIFGPVIGLMFGALADNLGYLMHPGVYMWEYTIQEPMIALIAGILGFIYFNYKGNKWVEYGLFQAILLTFVIIVIVVVTIQQPEHKNIIGASSRKAASSFLDNKMIPLIIVPIFYVIVNSVVSYIFFFKAYNKARLYIYLSIIIIQAWVIWSWIEGPWAQMRYWDKMKVWSGLKDQYKRELTIRWLFNIRVAKAKASIVVPLEIVITSALMTAYHHLPKAAFNNAW